MLGGGLSKLLSHSEIQVSHLTEGNVMLHEGGIERREGRNQNPLNTHSQVLLVCVYYKPPYLFSSSFKCTLLCPNLLLKFGCLPHHTILLLLLFTNLPLKVGHSFLQQRELHITAHTNYARTHTHTQTLSPSHTCTQSCTHLPLPN